MKNLSALLELTFNPELSINQDGKHVRDGLSTVLRTGDYLWVSCDERTTLERLKKTGENTYAEHKSFDLTQYLDLPDGNNSEIDIEGMGMAGGYLWLVGSHSLKRKKPKKEEPLHKQIKRLAKVKTDPNRYLLARIPLVQDAATGEYNLHKVCPDPNNPSQKLWAAQLKGSAKSNQLIDALAHDPHLEDFLPIPGKDNGFDIEGMALHEDRILLGLRGPVLRGWAILLEIMVQETEGKDALQLVAVTKDGLLYKKHFLHMSGKGVRELRLHENDLYILAGPTMDLDGVIAVYRWRNAVTHTQLNEQVVHRQDLEHLFDVPYGSGVTSGQDKAEGLTIYDQNQIVIVYDSPSAIRKPAANAVVADVYRVD
ncbi:MAG: DUF3616 domain-containing protein [Rufibacter sp.]